VGRAEVAVNWAAIVMLTVWILYIGVYTYLYWFNPDLVRDIAKGPKCIRKWLGSGLDPLSELAGSPFSIWTGRIVGPILLVASLVLLALVVLATYGLWEFP